MTTHRAESLYAEARAAGDRGPCGPISLSIITDLPYSRIVDLCTVHAGYVQQGKSGMWPGDVLTVAGRCGWEAEDFTLRLRELGAKTIQSLGWVLKKHFPNDRFLIETRDHFSAAVNGIVHDWAGGRKMPLVTVYRMVGK